MMSRRALAVLTAAALSGGFALAAPSQASAAPTSLMFSVYIEGSSNNKARTGRALSHNLGSWDQPARACLTSMDTRPMSA